MTQIKLAISGVLALFIIAFGCLTIYTIPAGHMGVVFNKMAGGVQDKPLEQGWAFVAPWNTVSKYPISTELAYYISGKHEDRDDVDDSIVIGTKDGKTIKVDAQVTYHMSPDKLSHIYNKFKGQDDSVIEYGYMKQNFQRIANDISSHYSMMDIVGEKKDEFNQELFKKVSEFFDEDGIIIEQASLGKVEPDDATKQAIQNVADAQYKQRQAEYEKVAAEAEAEKKVAVAKGDAEAKRIQADAEAYYNQRISESTTENVVHLKQIEKWDGKLPTYSGVSGAGFMFNK